MRKIPTVFVRDPATNLRHVRDEVNPGCEWVVAGEGVATRKYDGTCALLRMGRLYKRRELKPGQEKPILFEVVDEDPVTGKRVGWMPVDRDAAEDRYFVEALDRHLNNGETLRDGTYELVGPKVQGNPERFPAHTLIRHADAQILGEPAGDDPVPRDFAGLRAYLTDPEFLYEGIVWHHPDGRMAKLKRRDFPRVEVSA